MAATPCLGYNGIHNSLVIVVEPFAVPFFFLFFLFFYFFGWPLFVCVGCVDGRFACFPALQRLTSATRQLGLDRRSQSLAHNVVLHIA